MKKKQKKEETTLSFNSDDFMWCVENDFQVYTKAYPGNRAKIAFRRGGISSRGKDRYYDKETGITYTSEEREGKIIFKNQLEASKYLPYFYKQLIKRYG